MLLKIEQNKLVSSFKERTFIEIFIWHFGYSLRKITLSQKFWTIELKFFDLSVGFEVGQLLGWSEGKQDGWVDGRCVGCEVGWEVGNKEGSETGW